MAQTTSDIHATGRERALAGVLRWRELASGIGLSPITLPTATWRPIWTTFLAGLVLAVGAWVVVVALSDPRHGFLASAQDTRSYYGLNPLDPYPGRPEWGSVGAFPYSPAFAQFVWPLGLLPWPVFVATWTTLLLTCLAWLTGRRLLLVGLAIAAAEIYGGNISLLLAAAVVLGFRWPGTWALVLLTKVTPGVGLLWFVVRREWRPLAIALGTTAVVVACSAAIAPWAWPDWIAVLRENAGGSGTWAAVPVPLVVRLPLAVALVTWGARHDLRWTVPVSAMLALPALWYGSLVMMLAIIPLTDEADRDRFVARLDPWLSRLRSGTHRLALRVARTWSGGR